MPKVTPSQVRIAARIHATDAEICAMLGLTAEQLEKYRPHITKARTQAQAAVFAEVRIANTHRNNRPPVT